MNMATASKKQLLSLALIFCLTYLCGASPFSSGLSQNVMTLWTSRDGLPSDTILDGIQDGRGYIWLASYDGLVRFDGNNYMVFSPSQGGFTGKSPRALAYSPDGSIWIGTNTTGLFKYKDGGFTRYGIDEGLPDLSVRCLAVDRQGRIFVGTANGVARFENGHLLTLKGGMAADLGIANFLLPLEGGDILLGSNRSGLWVVRGEEIVPYLAGPSVDTNSFASAFIDSSNSLWLGTNAGLLFRVAGNQIVESIALPEIKDASINAFFADADGTLWIATDKGIVYRQNGAFNFFSEANGLPSNVVSSLWRDKEGNLWVATERGGLVKFSPGKFINIAKREGLISDAVNSVTEDSSGGIWVATDEGVTSFPSGRPLEREWAKSAQSLLVSLKGVRVRQVRCDRDGALWFSTYSDRGLLALRPNGKIESYSTKEGLPVNKVRNSMMTSSGAIWIGTANGAAVLSGGKITNYGKAVLPNTVILGAMEDSHGRVWLGTDGGGLVLFESGIFRVFTTKDGLASNVVFRALEDKAGRIWISTSDGLSLLREGKFSSVDASAGLRGESVFEVLLDPSGKLWIITGMKVIVASADALAEAVVSSELLTESRSFDRLDGLAGQLSANAWAYMNGNGVVYLPTLQGLSVYNPPIGATKHVAAARVR